jgi:hypothetical protein
LLQTDGSGQAGRASTDHDYVVFHHFARAKLGKNFFVGHGVSRSIMGLGCFAPKRINQGMHLR